MLSVNGLSLPNPVEKISSFVKILQDLHAGGACPDSLADEDIGEEENEERDEEVCKGEVENVLGWLDPGWKNSVTLFKLFPRVAINSWCCVKYEELRNTAKNSQDPGTTHKLLKIRVIFVNITPAGFQLTENW